MSSLLLVILFVCVAGQFEIFLSVACFVTLQEFPIGRATVERVGIYHSLHHFKFLLFTKCKEEVREREALVQSK